MRLGLAFCGLHNFCRLFPTRPPLFTANRVDGGEARAGVEPARQIWVPCQHRGLPREIDKYLLCDVLGAVFVATDVPERSRIDEVEVASDQFGESALVALRDKSVEQVGIGHRRFAYYRHHRPKPPKNTG